MLSNKQILIYSTLILSLFTTQGQALESTLGKQAYTKSCLPCHGATGIGMNGVHLAPNITLLKKSYAKSQFKNIMSGERKGLGSSTMMNFLKAMNLSDQELNVALEYALKLEESPSLHKNIKGNIKAGKKIYQSCVHCHGTNGQGYSNPALPAPRLVGQTDQYIITSLKHFKSETRGSESEAAKQMQAIAKTLKDDQAIADVTSYIRSLDTNFSQDLSDLSYKIYSGAWKKMPKFEDLEVIKSGNIPDGQLPDVRLAESDKDYAIVFEGFLNIKKTGTHQFNLTSDDGSILYLDNKEILNQDGVHGTGKPKVKKLQLKVGKVAFKLAFFQNAGGQALLLNWKEPKSKTFRPLTTDPLHKSQSNNGPKLPLAQKGNEALLLRNFFTDTGSRSIAVAYPGGFNLVYDVRNMALAYMWKGKFIDLGAMWNGRGTKYVFPSADTTKIYNYVQWAHLETDSSPWPQNIELPAKKYKAEKHIQFKGYKLDKNRFPSFLYSIQDTEIEDFFTPTEKGFKRDLKITSSNDKLYFKVALDVITQTAPNIYRIDDRYSIIVNDAVLRKFGAAHELIIPIKSKSSIIIEYIIQEEK